MNILALLTLLFSLKLFSGWGGTTEQSLLGLPFSRPPTPCLDLDMCLTAAHDIDSISAMEERSVRCCNSSSQLGMNQSSSVYPRYDKGRAIPKWARAKYSTYGFSRLASLLFYSVCALISSDVLGFTRKFLILQGTLNQTAKMILSAGLRFRSWSSMSSSFGRMRM